VSELEFNVPFQHKHSYIRDKAVASLHCNSNSVDCGTACHKSESMSAVALSADVKYRWNSDSEMTICAVWVGAPCWKVRLYPHIISAFVLLAREERMVWVSECGRQVQ